MRTRTPLLAVALLAVPAAVLVPIAVARGDGATAAPTAGDAGTTKRDPDNRTGLSEWMDRCVQGDAKFMAKDVPGAIDLYRQAIQLAPKRPLRATCWARRRWRR